MKSAHEIMLQIQREQQSHDLLAHRDILNLDTHTRLKHMALHFLKYAGKTATAYQNLDRDKLASIMLDTFIICLATANTLNVNLGKPWNFSAADLQALAQQLQRRFEISDVFLFSLHNLVQIGGKMAKSIESTDHLERGNPRAELEEFIVDLSEKILVVLSVLQVSIEEVVHKRWCAVEAKSIFAN